MQVRKYYHSGGDNPRYHTPAIDAISGKSRFKYVGHLTEVVVALYQVCDIFLLQLCETPAKRNSLSPARCRENGLIQGDDDSKHRHYSCRQSSTNFPEDKRMIPGLKYGKTQQRCTLYRWYRIFCLVQMPLWYSREHRLLVLPLNFGEELVASGESVMIPFSHG